MNNKRIYIIGIMFLLFMWLSYDGHHYWHEARFLYASTHFSIDELLSGEYIPHQLGGPIDEVGASGFYLSKVLHILLLKQLFALVPPESGGFSVAVWISFTFMVSMIFISYQIIRRLVGVETKPLFPIFCIAIMPITPYLAGKLLSEVPSLLFVSLSILLFIVGMDKKPHTLFRKEYLASGVFLLLAALSRLDMVICFFGFFVASIFFSEKKAIKAQLLQSGIYITAISSLLYVVIIKLLNKDFNVIVQYFVHYIQLDVKSYLMSCLGIMTFGGVIYVLSLFGIKSKNKKEAFFFITWIIFTLLPMVLITSNYMVEPRYLSSSMIPMAGLGTLGLDFIDKKFGFFLHKSITVLTVALIIVINIWIIKLMPYELDRKHILNSVKKILNENVNAAILVPYSYTDYHFLSVMFPKKRIYNVNTPNGNLSLMTEEWRTRVKRWYGSKFIENADTLKVLLSERLVYYLGWRKYPPVEFVKGVAESIGFGMLSNFIEALPLKDHLSESWVWNDPAFRLELSGKCGQYEYYRVALNRTESF